MTTLHLTTSDPPRWSLDGDELEAGDVIEVLMLGHWHTAVVTLDWGLQELRLVIDGHSYPLVDKILARWTAHARLKDR